MSKPVGKFTDPKSHAQVEIFAKKGESKEKAIARVTATHNVDPSVVKGDVELDHPHFKQRIANETLNNMLDEFDQAGDYDETFAENLLKRYGF